MDDAVELLGDFRDSMLTRQQQMREQHVRRCEITPWMPYELLLVDELAMLTAYGDRGSVREALRLLAEVLTQGRAADHGVAAYVQEPSKDVVDVPITRLPIRFRSGHVTDPGIDDLVTRCTPLHQRRGPGARQGRGGRALPRADRRQRRPPGPAPGRQRRRGGVRHESR